MVCGVQYVDSLCRVDSLSVLHLASHLKVQYLELVHTMEHPTAGDVKVIGECVECIKFVECVECVKFVECVECVKFVECVECVKFVVCVECVKFVVCVKFC